MSQGQVNWSSARTMTPNSLTRKRDISHADGCGELNINGKQGVFIATIVLCVASCSAQTLKTDFTIKLRTSGKVVQFHHILINQNFSCKSMKIEYIANI